MIDEQIEELKQENDNKIKKKQNAKFLIPDELYEKQDILEQKAYWEKLIRDIATNKLSPKEVTVLRVYFTFLNQKNTAPQDSDNYTFLRTISQLVKKNIPTLDKLSKPETQFKFTDDIKYRATELMMKVDLNELIQAKFSPLVESMLFVVVEAIQHLDSTSGGKSGGLDDDG